MDPDPDMDPDPQHCFKLSRGARKEPRKNRVVVVPGPPSNRALAELVSWKRVLGLLKSLKVRALCNLESVLWIRNYLVGIFRPGLAKQINVHNRTSARPLKHFKDFLRKYGSYECNERR